jgi:N-acetylmuramoyl-L-alanine amidase
MSKKVDFIVVHTSATSQKATVEGMKRYWKETLKWGAPGYHYVIDVKGTVTNLVPEDKVANGVYGINDRAVHVCYIGGIDAKGKALDTRTPEQLSAMGTLVSELLAKYPNAKLAGHHNFKNDAKKACPCFSVRRWADKIGIDPSRVYTDDPYGAMKSFE